MKKILLFALVLFISVSGLYAQCFSSTGNPIGGNANMGVTNKNMLRLSGFYKHAYSGKYFHGDQLSVNEGHITADYAVYNYMALMASYGLTKRMSLELSSGYFLNKTKMFESPMTGSGFSNLVVSSKYAFYKNPVKRIEITGSLGGKIPLKSEEEKLQSATIEIPKHPDVQSCLGNYGAIAQIYVIKENSFKGLRYFFISSYEHNFPSIDGYFDLRQFNFGNSLNTAVFVTKHLHMPPAFSWLSENWTAIAQIRHEHKFQNQKRSLNMMTDGNMEYGEWEYVKNSGSDVLFFCPQLNYTLAKKLNLSVQADIPLYQYYKGIQLASDFAFSINMTYDINTKKQTEEMTDLAKLL
jgi:hypothetical protein